MKWPEQFEIISEKISSKTGEKATVSAIAQFFEVSRGKVQAWSRGQRPSADDLENIAHKLEISPVWLLMGDTPGYESLHDNDLSIAETVDGKIVGDVLWLFFSNKGISIEDAAQRMGVSFEELDACIGRAPAPSWHMLQKMAAYGININFLLLGKGQDFLPQTEIERAMLAVGASNTWDMASKLGIRPKEIDHHLVLAKKEGKTMPYEWHEALLNKFGLNPAWTMSGKFPTHIETSSQPTTSQSYGTRSEARGNTLYEDQTEYSSDACDINNKPPTSKMQYFMPGTMEKPLKKKRKR